MVMHDFKLLLHQMKLRREALQNASMKSNDSINENFDQEISSSPLIPEVTEIVTRSRKITHKTVKKKSSKTVKKKKSSKSKKNLNRRILKLIKTPKLSVPKIISSNIEKQSLRKATKQKKLREHKCKRCDVKFDTKVMCIDDFIQRLP